MMNFKLRKAEPDESGDYVLMVNGVANATMNLCMWTGDAARLQKALKEAGF